jgi:tetratricopeptide (TPR) repeat protein
MNERYKIYGYEITTDSSFQNKKYGITPELASQLDTLASKSKNPRNRKIIDQLTQLILRYPYVPILKNYLSVAYKELGNYEKAKEITKWILTEHPDYLFARINQAHVYIQNGEYEKVPLILGKAMEIKELYPERDVFHLSEVTSFLNAAVRYFVAIENRELAENRLDMMKEIAPEHHETIDAETFLLPLRLKLGMQRWEKELKQRCQ